MYQELAEFIGSIQTRRGYWRDGELWTAVAVTIICGWLLVNNSNRVDDVLASLDDIVDIAAILLGFAVTTLALYVQAGADWKLSDPHVKTAAERLVADHVWTVLWLLVLLVSTAVIWLVLPFIELQVIKNSTCIWLVFLCSYVGFQILNHALTVRGVFMNLQKLTGRDRS